MEVMDAVYSKAFCKILEDLRIDMNGTWAIYGTGNGAELLYSVLFSTSVNDAIKYVIDRDDKITAGSNFHGIPVKKLIEVEDLLDGILIAAIDNHRVIWQRIQSSLTQEKLEHIRVIDMLEYNNTYEAQREYVEYIEKSIFRKSKEFVKFDEQGYKLEDNDTKIIAWYLPQFHQIEINNTYHGQGFTEWTNTSQAIPMFTGHYQPHIPYDVGYYDLLNIDTLKRQIYLAKHYGIYGFCFHYYWFSGKKIMEKPLEILLNHKELDMPFCINWATENWTALWDGGNNEIMLEQKLRDEDDRKFMEDIFQYMKDPRYIKIEGKPVLVIYRINLFSKDRVKLLLNNFRSYAKEKGFSDLYIMVTNASSFEENVVEWGADAIVEFPPHVMWGMLKEYKPQGYVNPYYNGIIYDAREFVQNKKYMLQHKAKKYFRSALTGWDNTARKRISANGNILYGLNPNTFKIWLADIIDESRKIHSPDENIVFVNSWNEWGEGSHLEPDMKYGYAYLQSLKQVLEMGRKESARNNKTIGKCDYAIL